MACKNLIPGVLYEKSLSTPTPPGIVELARQHSCYHHPTYGINFDFTTVCGRKAGSQEYQVCSLMKGHPGNIHITTINGTPKEWWIEQ